MYLTKKKIKKLPVEALHQVASNAKKGTQPEVLSLSTKSLLQESPESIQENL